MKNVGGQEVAQLLGERFVKFDEVARILTLGIRRRQNIILWGPGGHGKSEMVEAIVKHISKNPFIMSFGEDMGEADLWGGLDFKRLNRDDELTYHPELSFLDREVAVFEEIFDGPSVVLVALKDTMSARKLRKGAQQHPMSTEIIIGISNKDPRDIADINSSAAALVQRFPLQLKVEWGRYAASDYMELFRLREPAIEGANINTELLEILSALLAKRPSGNDPISPRTALAALETVKESAGEASRGDVDMTDLVELRFIEGLSYLARDIQTQIDAAHKTLQAEKRLLVQEALFETVSRRYTAAKAGGKVIPMMQAAHGFEMIHDTLSTLQVTEDLADRRKSLREFCENLMEEAKAEAYKATRVPDDFLATEQADGGNGQAGKALPATSA